jgi:hypothetical protein
VDKVREAVGEEHGSTFVTVSFGPGEAELREQFTKVAGNMSRIFARVRNISAVE